MPKHVTVRVYFPDEETKKRFATACFYEERKMSEVLAEYAIKWTEEVEKRRQKALGLPTYKPDTITELVQRNYYKLKQSKLNRLDAIAEGAIPDDKEIQAIATILNLDLSELQRLIN